MNDDAWKIARADRLTAAAKELRFLTSRGYPRQSALRFIGDHHQLDKTERNILFRAAFPASVAAERRKKLVGPGYVKGRGLVVDGYNVTITLESALAGRLLILADDGVVRDVSRIFRSFRPTERTKEAWMLIISLLNRYRPEFTLVLLDRPMRRSGELAARIRRWLQQADIPGDCRSVSLPERRIAALPGIKATADSAIMDAADKIFDLAGHIIRRRLHIVPFRC